ncbi:hypothetical protein HYW18_00765 [Candidatus Uhrbacteria bacterium]|nr:hypothetical protein [Candidatus Uhrbacteria bacterium]
MSLKETLGEIGLPKTKGEIYLALLRVGAGTAERIGREVGLPRTTAHEVLQQLVVMGLASYSTIGRRRTYRAEKPTRLEAMLREKQEKAARALPELLSLFRTTSDQPRIRLYEGAAGVKTVFEDTLNNTSRQLCAILSVADIDLLAGQDWFADYTTRRITSGKRLHVIRSEATEVGAKYPSSIKENREVHIAPGKMTFHLTMYLYDNKVAYMGTTEEPFGMIVESHRLFELQKNLFDVLWQTTRVLPPVDR